MLAPASDHGLRPLDPDIGPRDAKARNGTQGRPASQTKTPAEAGATSPPDSFQHSEALTSSFACRRPPCGAGQVLEATTVAAGLRPTFIYPGRISSPQTAPAPWPYNYRYSECSRAAPARGAFRYNLTLYGIKVGLRRRHERGAHPPLKLSPCQGAKPPDTPLDTTTLTPRNECRQRRQAQDHCTTQHQLASEAGSTTRRTHDAKPAPALHGSFLTRSPAPGTGPARRPGLRPRFARPRPDLAPALSSRPPDDTDGAPQHLAQTTACPGPQTADLQARNAGPGNGRKRPRPYRMHNPARENAGPKAGAVYPIRLSESQVTP